MTGHVVGRVCEEGILVGLGEGIEDKGDGDEVLAGCSHGGNEVFWGRR